MKRAILFILIGAALGGGGVWLSLRHAEPEKPAAETPAEKEAKASVSRDENGNAVVTMSDELQGSAGIVVANSAPAPTAHRVTILNRMPLPRTHWRALCSTPISTA